MSKYNRQQDEAVEKFCAQRIDQWYTQHGISFERVQDEQRQFSGIDLVVHGKTRDINIDEKAKFHGIEDGKEISSIAFEVCRKCRDGSFRLGWFVDKGVQTDVYCFLFPKLQLDGVGMSKKSVDYHFSTSMSALFVQKSDVVQFILGQQTVLCGEGYKIQSLDEIVEFAEQMIQNDMRRRSSWEGSFWMTRSTQLWEEPVNVVIPVSTLRAFPHSRYIEI